MELDAWREFYRLYPFDDYHRFHRPAALVSLSLGGGADTALRDRLDWLQPKPMIPDFSQSDTKTLAAFGITPPTAFMKARTE